MRKERKMWVRRGRDVKAVAVWELLVGVGETAVALECERADGLRLRTVFVVFR
jgi:hypothetical protein